MTLFSKEHLSKIFEIDPAKPVHFTAIGGSAMSGLAKIMSQLGFIVVGTDPGAEEKLKKLSESGILVSKIQDGSFIKPGTGLLIFSAAINKDNAEYLEAKRQKIKILKYSDCLGALVNNSKGIAISGTHGKTTTSAMIISILSSAGLDPGFIIGGVSKEFSSNAKSGKAPYFIAEACEYNRSFLSLEPTIGVITNIEEEHLDTYENLDQIKSAFLKFANNIKPGGTLIYNADCASSSAVACGTNSKSVSFSTRKKADFDARNIKFKNDGTNFDFYRSGKIYGKVKISLPGIHNVQNMLAALSVASLLKISVETAAHAAMNFSSVLRRFDILGDVNGVTVLDDYAHHPTEIKALLGAVRQRFGKRRIVAVFQPHQYFRTYAMFDDFCVSFNDADEIFITDIFASRDIAKSKRLVNAQKLARAISAKENVVQYSGSIKDTSVALKDFLKREDVLVTIGAGDVFQIANDIISSYVD